MQLKNDALFRQQAFINGVWCDADNKQTHEVLNPATGEVIGTVPMMGANETRRAIEAADTAQSTWAKKTGKERSIVLRRWHTLIAENIEDLALLMTHEQGKPIGEAKGEIQSGLDYLEWFAEEAKRVYGDVIPGHMADKRLIVIKQPVGVTAAITPWNFPHSMISRKAGPALAAGCPMIVKPAMETPYSALAMAYLAQQAGIPDGIYSVVTGDPVAIGEEMTTNPMVKKISFTGSTRVGKILMKQCADTVKKMSMELGGNAPFIVFDDADIDAAVTGAMMSKYRNSGQTCVCANRLFVQAGVYEAFSQKLAEQVRAIKVGNGLESGVTQGPLISKAAADNTEALVEDAKNKGATVLCGGQRVDADKNFFNPTILTDVNNDMRIANEEIFAPIAPIFKFDTDEEAVALANRTEYGLAGYFYSRDIGRVWRIAEALEVGMVGVNTGMLTTELAPFGGVKESGMGREGSKYGIEEYVETKYICLDIN
ncbi:MULTISPECIES: NAD-dependent succinate-semialdehyde dehydrogenase [Psychrobacter]|uniref:Succinate-semialdehyde dehydrogenase n=1 Tax=Psychrobacter alimentarius TaxID=261164 RepID=A0ABM5ZXH9_9GAMM|nr:MULTISPECIES: NAD-dependent succinate-semialdehyde dehydrogenase [Psychrobacter]AMT96844.1 Succinate-semialdehyde dehydrogenase [Psychrobacter alimentarius]QCB30792.1 NAD-dependent succinate-semialdehyde dehydrogenase [Psychrobacter sp. PAMC27889]